MVYSKDFDIYLRVTKGAEQYHLDKVRAGAMGGSAGRGKKKPSSIMNAKLMWWSKIKKPTRLSVVCLRPLVSYSPIFRFEVGNHYNITVDSDIRIIEPTNYKFESWPEFLLYFKRLKTLPKEKPTSYPRRTPTGSVSWNKSRQYWRARITSGGKTYEKCSTDKNVCIQWLDTKKKELSV